LAQREIGGKGRHVAFPLPQSQQDSDAILVGKGPQPLDHLPDKFGPKAMCHIFSYQNKTILPYSGRASRGVRREYLSPAEANVHTLTPNFLFAHELCDFPAVENLCRPGGSNDPLSGWSLTGASLRQQCPLVVRTFALCRIAWISEKISAGLRFAFDTRAVCGYRSGALIADGRRINRQ
jgi:hypothetical protein